MPLESGDWIDDLDEANPVGGDDRSEGDNHLRLIKHVLLTTFPRTGKEFSFPTVLEKVSSYTVLVGDDNTLFVASPTLGDVTLTLPGAILTPPEVGWSIWVMRKEVNANHVFVSAGAGSTINGYATVRRSIPFGLSKIIFDGTDYVASRVPGVPIGSVIRFDGTLGTPTGYLAADGSLIVAVDYPELHAEYGGGLATLPNVAGHIVVAE